MRLQIYNKEFLVEWFQDIKKTFVLVYSFKQKSVNALKSRDF